MDFLQTTIPDILLIKPRIFSDERGYFMESYQTKHFSENGINETFVQDNYSSSKQGVLRGLHYQIQFPQGKLVRAINGKIFDVSVDLRRSSPTFGKWIGVILSEENKHQLWIPPGFAHGFYVLSKKAEVFYKTTDYYSPNSELTLSWNDPSLDIDWPLLDGASPIISEKDSIGTKFSDADYYV